MDEEELKKSMMAIYKLLGDPELTQLIGDFTWNLFIKLQAKGFTDDQAMMIVSSFSKPK